MGSYVAGAWAVDLEPEPPLFSRLQLRPKRAAPAPQHCPQHLETFIIYTPCPGVWLDPVPVHVLRNTALTPATYDPMFKDKILYNKNVTIN